MGLTVDLCKIRHNVNELKKRTSAKLCCVVKSDAYGHGAVEVAKYIDSIADCFAVANGYEAKKLTTSGIKKDIIVLSGAFDGNDYPDNVIFTAVDSQSFFELKTKRKNFLVKINTGMNRLGLTPNEFDKILKNGDVSQINSVFSHIYNIENAEKQFEILKKYQSLFKTHLCASNFLSLGKNYHLDMVRCGIALYGFGANFLKPAMSLTCEVLQVFKVKKGEHIGYGNEIIANDTRIATISIGYGDGVRRKNGNDLFVYIKGVKCRVVGQVCMDVSMIELSDNLDCKRGDEVEILGENQTAEDVARQWNTIPYEVLINLSHFRNGIKYIK